MCSSTNRALAKVPLETPYGTVNLLFQSEQECVVLLPDQHTEPPTVPLTLDSVTIEGSLVFERWGQAWEFQANHERSRCWDVDTDCPISRERRAKLAQTLSQLLEPFTTLRR